MRVKVLISVKLTYFLSDLKYLFMPQWVGGIDISCFFGVFFTFFTFLKLFLEIIFLFDLY